ncbi:MAG: hypothetical protein V4615_17105 [Bacteroidota bacterium]
MVIATENKMQLYDGTKKEKNKKETCKKAATTDNVCLPKEHLKWEKPDPSKPGNKDTRVKDLGT